MSFVIFHPDVDGAPISIPEHALPTYAARGWVLAEPERDPFANPPKLPLPARNATAAVWKTYAVVAGMPYDEAMAATRDELADKYHPAPAPAPAPKTPGKGSDTNKES